MSALYGVPYPIAPLSHSEISAGVIEWSQQYFNETDLQVFAVQTETAVRNVSAYHVVGNGTGYAGDEASLDIQWLEGINPVRSHVPRAQCTVVVLVTAPAA